MDKFDRLYESIIQYRLDEDADKFESRGIVAQTAADLIFFYKNASTEIKIKAYTDPAEFLIDFNSAGRYGSPTKVEDVRHVQAMLGYLIMNDYSVEMPPEEVVEDERQRLKDDYNNYWRHLRQDELESKYSEFEGSIKPTVTKDRLGNRRKDHRQLDFDF